MKSFCLTLMAAAVLSACSFGGGGDSSSTTDSTATTTTLSGTAAGGAAVVGMLTVKDSLGAVREVSIGADGSYSVDVAGMTAPFMVEAAGIVGAKAVRYYAGATAADLGGNINVTPLTSLILSNIAAKTADAYYAEGAFAAGITAAALDAARSDLQQKIAPLLLALGIDASVDLLRQSFAADHTGLDAALDLIGVSIDPATQVATLINRRTSAVIGSDDLRTRDDDRVSIVVSDSDLAGLTRAQGELLEIRALLAKLGALYATGLPNVEQLSASGLFDTSTAFAADGATFLEFASELEGEEELRGAKLVSSDIEFSPEDPNRAELRIYLLKTNGTTEKIDFDIFRVAPGSAWKITGNGRIADIEVRALTVLADSANGRIDNGIHAYIDPSDYNENMSGLMVTGARLTGPGILPRTGVVFAAVDGVDHLVVAGNSQGNMVPECSSTKVTDCLDVSGLQDNGVYKVELFSGDLVLNAGGYSEIVAKAPVATAMLSAASFPSLTALTIDGNTVEQLAQFGLDRAVSAAWTMPASLRSEHLSVVFDKGIPAGSAGSERVEEDLGNDARSAMLDLGMAPANATRAQLYLSGRDVYDRRFVFSKTFVQ